MIELVLLLIGAAVGCRGAQGIAMSSAATQQTAGGIQKSWTHPSVLTMAAGMNPIAAITAKSRETIFKAIQAGSCGWNYANRLESLKCYTSKNRVAYSVAYTPPNVPRFVTTSKPYDVLPMTTNLPLLVEWKVVGVDSSKIIAVSALFSTRL